MSTNPRFIVLMANYRQYDHLTLVLAGIALLAVLGGWAMLGRKTPRWQRDIYFGFLIFAFVLTMAGSAYLIIRGGPP